MYQNGVNSGLFAWYFTPNSGCGLPSPPQDLLSFWNKVPFAMSYLLHATFLFSHFMATHLRDAHAAARQRGRPWSAVLTRIDLGFTFVHRKLSRGSQRPSSSLSFWHYFCSWYKFPRLRHAVHHDSGRPPCSPQRVLLPCLSYLLIIHPTPCQLRR